MFGYFDALLRYFEFSGRTSRTQYWMFQLTTIVVIVAAVFAEFNLHGRLPGPENLGFFTLFVAIFHTVPGITVTVRRLHDSGRSGWWYWIGLVPIIGGIWLLVLMCFGPDTYGPNEYGDDPRQGTPEPVRAGKAPQLSRSQAFLAEMAARRGG